MKTKNLKNADLRGADLRGADLRGADLRGADLRGADLRGADLEDANLKYADLEDANLRGADLSDANLRGADLEGADLKYADLSDANLRGANLRGANLRDADLAGVKHDHLTAGLHLVCPEEGEFIGWKKVAGCIVKLRVLADAKRSSATSRKCRCSEAEVLEIQNLDGTPAREKTVQSTQYYPTEYTVGKTVKPDSWDENRWNECSHGIHFFVTRDEAVHYQD